MAKYLIQPEANFKWFIQVHKHEFIMMAKQMICSYTYVCSYSPLSSPEIDSEKYIRLYFYKDMLKWVSNMVCHLHFVLAWMQQSSFVSGISFWSMQFWDTGYLHLLKLWWDIFDITCISLPFAFQFFHITVICMHAQLCLTLWDPMDYSPPGSSVHRIFQSRILEWVAIPFSRGSSGPRDQTHISCIGTEPPGKPLSVISWSQM